MFGEYTANWIATIYVVGFLVTYVVNAVLFRNDPIPRGGTVICNAVLWPLCLPLLIFAAIVDYRGSR